MSIFQFSAPLFFYSAFFGFFILGEYLFRLWEGNLPPGSDLWLQDLLISNAISLLIIVAWELNRRPSNRKLPHIDSKEYFSRLMGKRIKFNLLTSIFVLIAIGVISIGNPFADPLGFRQAIQGGGAAYFLVYFIFMEKLYGVYYFNRLYNKQTSKNDTFLAIILILFSLTTGFASIFVYFFIYGMVFLNAKYRVRVVGFWSIFLFMALLILTPIYTLVRENLRFGGGELGMVFNSFTTKLDTSILDVIYDRFDYFDLQVVGAELARKYADPALALDSLVQFVPRGLWSDKPPTYSLFMTTRNTPALLDIGVTNNFGYVNEFVLYLGDFGPIASGIFLGILFCYCNTILRKRHNSRSILFYTIVVHGYVLAFMSGGYLNDLPFAQLIMGLFFYRVLGLSKAFVTPGVDKAKALQAAQFN